MSQDAADYQQKIATMFGDAPPQPGMEFQVDDRWFDGVKQGAKILLEAKGRLYERLFEELVDKRNITAPLDKAVKELEDFAAIAERHGYTLDVHCAEESVARRLQQKAPAGVRVFFTAP
jgi:hypothetical protein